MKKFIVTILAVLYLGVSSGATVHFHYCMGRLVEWGLVSKESAKCSKCGMKAGTTKNCCKKENKQIKVDSAQKVSYSSFHFEASSFDVITNNNAVLPHIYISSVTEEYPLTNAPPSAENTPVFLRNRNFRI